VLHLGNRLIERARRVERRSLRHHDRQEPFHNGFGASNFRVDSGKNSKARIDASATALRESHLRGGQSGTRPWPHVCICAYAALGFETRWLRYVKSRTQARQPAAGCASSRM
jgi:hypothetical protein